MPLPPSRPAPMRTGGRRRGTAALAALSSSTLVVAALASGVGPASAAAPSRVTSAAAATAARVAEFVPDLVASFDPLSSSVPRGHAVDLSGTIAAPTGTIARRADGVPASFTLRLSDPDGRVLATQDVTAANDGSFATTVPGAATQRVRGTDAVTLSARAVDASASLDGERLTAADAGAGAVRLAGTGGLELENSFVSAVGWVKPGEDYPARVFVRNPGASSVDDVQVTLTAPDGTTVDDARSPAGTITRPGGTVTWTIPTVPAAQGDEPGTVSMVVDSTADTTQQQPEIVWRDLSSTAVLTVGGAEQQTAVSHGPKVIPPSPSFDTARYGDRPFPVVPVSYTDRDYQPGDSGGDLDSVINDPANEGSTFNLYQEMSLGQLFPHGSVPAADVAQAGFGDPSQYRFTHRATPGSACTGTSRADGVGPTGVGGLNYTDRIVDGVYQLPGDTQYYGQDANGSALVGAVSGVGALQDIDSACGPAGKLVYDAAAIADPEIDYSDFDTDKDGVVDFFMAVFAGCGGNGGSQLGPVGCPFEGGTSQVPYDNVWPHSSSLEFYYTDPETGLSGYTSHDQLVDEEGHQKYYTSAARQQMTNEVTDWPVYVRVGPYNVNPETAIDKASVISHEYGHSLGLPDFYSLGTRETYGDWNLMATDKSQNMDVFSRQEMGWVVPEVLSGDRTVTDVSDSKQDTGTITWQTPDGQPYTLRNGADGPVHNARAFVAKLPGRQLIDPAKFDSGEGASATHAWWSGSGNDFGCATDGGGHNLDLALPELADAPSGTTVDLTFKSLFDIEWDYDYGFVLTSTDGGHSFSSNPSENETPTTTTTNANANACQQAYGNGITGSSTSYSDGTVAQDRLVGNYPSPTFLSDEFDISELAGARNPVLRFSYSTDPGLARPGWFFDDIAVTVTEPGRDPYTLFASDLEGDGGPDDPRVFNGACKDDAPDAGSGSSVQCTQGWNYIDSSSAAPSDHAYYLEMRDRSGFDLDGHGEIDRDPIGWAAGLSMVYTDEAHGYGNVGTDSPPAQSPLDSQPNPGDESPDLDDAAWTAAQGDSHYSDSGSGHVDNYTNPAEDEADPASGEANPWRFAYDCLTFDVRSMSGQDDGPPASDGDLTGAVDFDMGRGCGTYDYGYPPTSGGTDNGNTPPVARASATPSTVETGEEVQFSGAETTDTETPDDLDYSWNFRDGGSTKDAVGKRPTRTFAEAGTYRVRLSVTDPRGASDTDVVAVTVTKKASGNTAPTARGTATPKATFRDQAVTLSGARSSDAETPDRLRYTWNYRNGGSRVDARGTTVQHRFTKPGVHRVVLTVTDPRGRFDTDVVPVTTKRKVACESRAVEHGGSWHAVDDEDADDGTYCTDRGRGRGRDLVTLDFLGPRIDLAYGRSRSGGDGVVQVDGERVASLPFGGRTRDVRFGFRRVLDDLGNGQHTLRIASTDGDGFLDFFVTRR